MIRSFAVALITIVVVVLFGLGNDVVAVQPVNSTGAGQVPFQFTGATPGVNLELFVNAGKVADVSIGVNGTGNSILDLSNLGKVQLQVYVDVCQDGKVIRVLVVGGQPKPEDNCKRRIVGAAWWSDCGVTRITLDLTKFGMRVIGCGAFYTNPKYLIPIGGGLALIPILGGGDGNGKTTFVSVPITTPTTPTNTTVTTPPPVTQPTPAPEPTPVEYSVTVTSSYNHPGGSTSIACILIVTAPPQAAGTYVVTFSGPGIVSGASASGSLNAAGRAIAQAIINAFGSYTANVSVTSSGVTRTGTGSINVVAANATCPALQ